VKKVAFIIYLLLTCSVNNDKFNSFYIEAPNFNISDLKCMVENIYHEGRGESVEGWSAIMSVVIERSKDKRWPKNICKVVWQEKQFSWTINPEKVKDFKTWGKIANFVLNANSYGFETTVKGANHYHTTSIDPKWNNGMMQINIVGNHVFYRG
jgi:spore germination cell wall hydrolase CwlJ-like protein